MPRNRRVPTRGEANSKASSGTEQRVAQDCGEVGNPDDQCQDRANVSLAHPETRTGFETETQREERTTSSGNEALWRRPK